MSASEHYAGQVIEYRPRVTGGRVVAVVTAVHNSTRFGTTLEIRVTDGTRYWPTGYETAICAEDAA